MQRVGIFTLFVVIALFAQSPIGLDSIKAVNHFNDVVQWYESGPVLSLNWFDDTATYSTAFKLKKEYQRDQIKATTPLSLQGGYRYYMRDFDIEPDEVEVNSKLSLGLQYRFLRGGLATKKNALQTIEEELKSDSLQWSDDQSVHVYNAWRYVIRKNCNARLYELYELYALFLESYKSVAAKHYFDKKMSKEHYEEVLTLKEESEILLNILKGSQSENALSLPLLSLVAEKCTLNYKSTSSSQYLKSRYIDRIALNATLTGEVYPRYEDSRGNLIAGLHFSMPLESVKKVENSHAKRLSQYDKRTQEHDLNRRKQMLELQLAEYHAAAADLSRVQSRVERRKKFVEKEFFNISYFEATPDFLALYNAVDLYTRSLIQLVEQKRRTMLKIVTIAEITGMKSVEQITEKQKERRKETLYVRKGNRSMYLWKRAFDNTSILYLKKFCHLRQIDRLYLSASRFSTSGKKIEALKESGLNVIPLFSENSWALKEKHEKALKKISNIADSVEEIHLDIEPHALEGWRDNNYEILDEFILLLQRIRGVYKGRISLSLPAIYPQNYYKKMYIHVDRIEYMIYGKSATNTFAKLESIVIGAPEYSLAVRISDFEDENNLEQFVDTLIKKGVKDFTLFDYESYKEMVSK